MKYISLDKIRNSYPLDKQKRGGVISQTYSTDIDQSIVNQGEFPQSKAKFPQPPQAPPPLGDDIYRGYGIQSVKGTTFRFILEIDGVKYTSPGFANDLENAKAESNPYFTESNVSTIRVSSKNITTPSRDYKVGLRYSESTINNGSNLINGDHLSIVRYIDNLVKPVIGEDGDKISNVDDMGSWQVNTTKYDPISDSGMGFEFSDLLEEERKLGSREEKK